MPIVEKLVYTSNEDIAKMYINLLASAASEDHADRAHPRFKSLIESLSADEAKIINALINKKSIPYITLVATDTKRGGTKPVKHCFSPLLKEIDVITNIELYVDNLIGLDILTDSYPNLGEFYNDYQVLRYAYEGYKKEYIEVTKNRYNADTVIDFIDSFLEVSAIGKKFVQVCTSSSEQ